MKAMIAGLMMLACASIATATESQWMVEETNGVRDVENTNACFRVDPLSVSTKGLVLMDAGQSTNAGVLSWSVATTNGTNCLVVMDNYDPVVVTNSLRPQVATDLAGNYWRSLAASEIVAWRSSSGYKEWWIDVRNVLGVESVRVKSTLDVPPPPAKMLAIPPSQKALLASYRWKR